MTQTLEQLSAAATELLPCPFCGGTDDVVQSVVRAGHVFQIVECTKCGIEMAGHTEAEAIAAWNTRTGQFVAVSDDAIERVARALCEASGEAWRSGEGLRYPFSQNAKQLNNHWLYKAKAAIAAMKDTQPALAAKGTGDELPL